MSENLTRDGKCPVCDTEVAPQRGSDDLRAELQKAQSEVEQTKAYKVVIDNALDALEKITGLRNAGLIDHIQKLRAELQKAQSELEEEKAKFNHCLTVNEEGTLQWWIQKHDKLARTLAELLVQVTKERSDAQSALDTANAGAVALMEIVKRVKEFPTRYSYKDNQIELDQALSTPTGTAYQERLRDAETLLREISDVKEYEECEPFCRDFAGWFERRDAWLKNTPPTKQKDTK